MSLFSFLTEEPRITGSLNIDLSVLGFDTTRNNALDITIPISASLLPDIELGNGSNNLLQGNSSSFSESVSIPPFPVTLRFPTIEVEFIFIFPSPIPIPIPTFGTINETFDVVIPPFPLPNTPEDFIAGFGGNDLLRGFGGSDVLIGDDLFSQASDGVDTLEGGSGEDVLIGGGAGDRIDGGNDDDFILGDYFLGLVNENILIDLAFPGQFVANNANIAELEFLGSIPIGNASYDANIGVEFGPTSITIGSGNEGNDTINGGNGNDVILADRGNDRVNGDNGIDIIIGGADNDIINGGEGNDIISGDYIVPQGFSIPTDEEDFAIDLGVEGNDTISGGAGDDVILGDGGDDDISGDQGVDVIIGGADNDIINGGEGNDIITGDYIIPQGFSVPTDEEDFEIDLGVEGNDTIIVSFPS
ncbi:MAG: calcium-binding protein, partial [Cyanobacteria bacterium J06643_5]